MITVEGEGCRERCRPAPSYFVVIVVVVSDLAEIRHGRDKTHNASHKKRHTATTTHARNK